MRAMPVLTERTNVCCFPVNVCTVREYMRNCHFLRVADAYSMCTLPYMIQDASYANNLRQAEARPHACSVSWGRSAGGCEHAPASTILQDPSYRMHRDAPCASYCSKAISQTSSFLSQKSWICPRVDHQQVRARDEAPAAAVSTRGRSQNSI